MTTALAAITSTARHPRGTWCHRSVAPIATGLAPPTASGKAALIGRSPPSGERSGGREPWWRLRRGAVPSRPGPWPRRQARRVLGRR